MAIRIALILSLALIVGGIVFLGVVGVPVVSTTVEKELKIATTPNGMEVEKK